MDKLDLNRVYETIGTLLTEQRRERIRQIVENRTQNILPVLENIYDRGNVSAVLRSAEAFGFQNVHLVENSEKFKVANRVTQGADKWLTLRRWKNSDECISTLKEKKIQILVTHLEGARPIGDFDFTLPTAIVFGNEKEGVSSKMIEASDAKVKIPMLGMVQSFNISVAAALCFYHIYLDRIRRQGYHGDLTVDEKEKLIAEFYIRTHPSLYKIT